MKKPACMHCDGRGRVPVAEPLENDPVLLKVEYKACPACNGTGFGAQLQEKASSSVPTHDPNWHELYEAALLEYNPTELDKRIAAARKAIHRRLTQDDYISPEERQKIDDALSALFALTRERRARNET
jgi:hypothetical protein